MVLEMLAGRYAVCSLDEASLPDGELVSLTTGKGEISLVCEEAKIPAGCRAETGWRALRVQGPLGFTLIGILAELSRILADAGVSIFALSTYDTDYLLVKQECIDTAERALSAQGHTVISSQ